MHGDMYFKIGYEEMCIEDLPREYANIVQELGYWPRRTPTGRTKWCKDIDPDLVRRRYAGDRSVAIDLYELAMQEIKRLNENGVPVKPDPTIQTFWKFVAEAERKRLRRKIRA